MARKKEEGEKFESPVGHPKDRIILHQNPNIAKEGQFVSLNGYGFLLKAGVEIDIPRPVRKMLDTLIETVTSQDAEGNEYTRDVPRFSYTLIKENVNVNPETNEVYEIPPETPPVQAQAGA
jgi:hypothetical protein